MNSMFEHRARSLHESVDWQHLEMLAEGDDEFLKSYILLFLTTSTEILERLESAITEGEKTSWLAQTHKLYGASANIGATALAELCDTAQKTDEAALQRMQHIHVAIMREASLVRDSLQRMLARWI